MAQDVVRPEKGDAVHTTAAIDESRQQDARPTLSDWLELRLSWKGFIQKNMDEPMPPGVGWWQTLGNLLMTLLMLQFITGVALALFYAPTPDHAYESVKSITDEVPFGAFVRGIHHWGGSLIVIFLTVHMLRVFFWGSYKKPREITWLSGVLIFQVILGFSFTGYLLPWDQKAYWATVVGTRIASTVPWIGDTLLRLIRGGDNVGALTLTRFFTIHVMVLPAVLMAFVGLHLFQVRAHHTAGPVVARKGEAVPFWPVQLFRDAVVVLVAFAILLALALLAKPELSGVADPSKSDFAPRPEWYFLGLFELLKLIPPKLEVVGTCVIPGLLTAGMFLLPWLDRSPSRHPAKRQWVIDVGLLLVFGIGILTLKGILAG